MFFMRNIIDFYVSIIPIYCISSLISAFFRFNLAERIWTNTLDRFFSYTATIFKEEHHGDDSDNGSVPDSLRKKDSIENFSAYEANLIERDVCLTEDGIKASHGFFCDATTKFQLHHPIYLVKSSIEAIIEDDVTRRFTAAELKVWNFLSRNPSYTFINTDYNMLVNFLWLMGFFIRYFMLFPCRIFVFLSSFIFGLLVGMIIIFTPTKQLKSYMRQTLYSTLMRYHLRSYSTYVRFHNLENQPKFNSICVANHTTPLDYVLLCADIPYSIIGQTHSGLFGFAERIIGNAIPSVWFDRSEVLDRNVTAKKLHNHTLEEFAPPLLVFPEGTCINNTSVMKFKKGCFEVKAPCHPVTIKYDPRFSDCFWNSTNDSLLQYLVKLMTSWAVVVDVWYLNVENKDEKEDASSFARKIKQSIAKKGALDDMEWDGDLKRKFVRPDLRRHQQAVFSQTFIAEETKE